MRVSPDLARLAAHVYGVCAILMGLVSFAVFAVLQIAFGFRPHDWLGVVLLIGSGLLFIALGCLIWRQNLWAMIATLVAITYWAVMSDPGPALGLVLIVFVPLFALCTLVGILARRAA